MAFNLVTALFLWADSPNTACAADPTSTARGRRLRRRSGFSTTPRTRCGFSRPRAGQARPGLPAAALSRRPHMNGISPGGKKHATA